MELDNRCCLLCST